jgi:cellulose synthase (UDP-forming)
MGLLRTFGIKQGVLQNNALSQIAISVSLTFVVFLVVHLAERYLGIPLELSLSWCLLAFAVILNKMVSFKEAPGRFIFILIIVIIALRYFFWRTFDTLLYAGPFDFIGMLLIYLAECYSIIMLFLGMFISIWPLENQPAPLPDDTAILPTVDIFIPTFTESEEIVRLTVTAVTQIHYPRDKYTVYLMDDGSSAARRNDPETSAAALERYSRFKIIAEEFGAVYLTRERNDHAKAGNINHALTKSSGDLVLFLDCDHVPTKDILQNTVGWFLKDKKLFLVQTPHFFINTTTVEKNIGSFSNAPGENDMFYYGIQPGMDLWNASYFCGSAAVLRRSLLLESGGIAEDTVTEDAGTSLHLHGKGYNSRYVNRPMVCGLSPETFDDYVVQRTRWAQGMSQLFVLSNPLFIKGLTIPQRLCYFNSIFYWFFGMARFIFYIGPSLFLVLGLKVYHASVTQIIAYALPYVLCIIVVMDFLYGRFRRRFFSDIYESVQTMFLAPAVFSALFNPKKPSFKLTPKGKKIHHEFLNPMATVFFIVLIVNFIGMGFAVVKWHYYPLFRTVIFVAFCWCLYNAFLGLITLGAFWERQQLRQYHRTRSRGTANVFFPMLNKFVSGEIKDLSLTGIAVELELTVPVTLGEEIRFESTDSYGNRFNFLAEIKTQRERDGRSLIGLEFILDENAYSQIVGFVYGDSQRWAEIRAERCQPVSSSKVSYNDLYHFLQRGVKGSFERFAFFSKQIPSELRKHLPRISAGIQALQLRIKRSIL